MKTAIVVARHGHKVRLSKVDPDDTAGVIKEAALEPEPCRTGPRFPLASPQGDASERDDRDLEPLPLRRRADRARPSVDKEEGLERALRANQRLRKDFNR